MGRKLAGGKGLRQVGRDEEVQLPHCREMPPVIIELICI